jgi:hypothetical protein
VDNCSTTGVEEGASYVFAVTVFCAAAPSSEGANDNLYTPVAFFDSPPFTIATNTRNEATVETAAPVSAPETIEDLLALYETLRAREAAAQHAAVRRTLHQASQDKLLTSMLGRDTPAGRSRADGDASASNVRTSSSSAARECKLDLLAEDVLEMVSDSAATSCLECNWYSPRGTLVPDPTVRLMRRLHETSVLERALQCIMRHNDVAESAAQPAEAAEIDVQDEGKTSRGGYDQEVSVEDQRTATAEAPLVAEEESAPRTPPEFTSPTYLHDRLLHASATAATTTATSTLAELFFSPSSSSTALERQFFADLLHNTQEPTARVAQKLRTARRQPLSPAYDFFCEVMADVKDSHRALCRAFLLNEEFPELPGLSEAVDYLHSGRYWVFEGSEVGPRDTPHRAGRMASGISMTLECSEGRTDQELTADSCSSERDDRADASSTPSASTEPARSTSGDRKKRKDRAGVSDAPIGSTVQTSGVDTDGQEPTLEAFQVRVTESGASSCAAVELLSLLADRVCSGAHAEAARAHRRAEKIRRALRRQVDCTEAATRAAMRASYELFGGKRVVKKIVRSVKKEMLGEEEGEDNQLGRSSSRRASSKRKEPEMVDEREETAPRKSLRGRVKGGKQNRKTAVPSGRGRVVSTRVPVHGLIAAGAYKNVSQRDPESSMSTESFSDSSDTDGSLCSVSGEEDDSESVDEMEVEAK